eukprot:scpid27119/ scgid21935/ 
MDGVVQRGNTLNCRLALHVHQVSRLHGRLSSDHDVFVRAVTLDQSQSTRKLPHVLPLHYNQVLFFSQVYTDTLDPAALHVRLQGEPFLLEVLQLSSRQTGCATVASCQTTIGELLSGLQRPRRLANGSLAISTGDVRLHTAAGQTAQLMIRYSLDLTIVESRHDDPVRPLIDLPSAAQVAGMSGMSRAGIRTKHDTPFDIFEGRAISMGMPPTASAGPTAATHTAAESPPPSSSSSSAVPRHSRESCPQSTASQGHAAAASTSTQGAAATPVVSSAVTSMTHRQEQHAGVVPSLSALAPRRTLVHCALPRTATGLASAKPLDRSCTAHCHDTDDDAAAASHAVHPRPFAVRRAEPDLYRRRDLHSAVVSRTGATRSAHSVEFVDHPSRPPFHRHSSPLRSGAPSTGLERSPLKPTRSAPRKTASTTARKSLDLSSRSSSSKSTQPRPGTALPKAPDTASSSRSHATASLRVHAPESRSLSVSDRAKPACRSTGPGHGVSAPEGDQHAAVRSSHVRFVTPEDEDSASYGSGSSLDIGPITVTASSPSSDDEDADNMTLAGDVDRAQSPPLSPDHFATPATAAARAGAASDSYAASVGMPSSAARTAYASHATVRGTAQAQDCDTTLRRMQQCGDEVKKLSLELQTRIDSLLGSCCPPARKTPQKSPGSASMATTRPTSAAAEDLEDLRTSLHSARQERLRQHQAPAVDRPVRISDNSYWSQQMSQYTGRSHRQLFDETLEKAYVDLYQRAVKTK